jgi:hypothetical protein
MTEQEPEICGIFQPPEHGPWIESRVTALRVPDVLILINSPIRGKRSVKWFQMAKTA